MHVSLTNRATGGFKRWSDAHRSSNDDDDNSGGATPIAITVPPRDDRETIEDPPHRPWIVPGTGGSF